MEIIIAAILVIPLILIPVAVIWFINVSGLYQVMKDARTRQKVRTLKTAKEFVEVEE